MKHGEYKEVNGFIVRKETTTFVKTRDGYAKTLYHIYENIEQMNEFKPISLCYTMAEVREEIKYIK